MSVISKRFADELDNKEMRDAYLEEQTRGKLAQQIRALRAERNWSQAQLGQVLGKPQSNVARLEDTDVARYTLSTLFGLASAFDVGLVVKFVPYAEFLKDTSDLSHDSLRVEPYTKSSLAPLLRDQQTAFSEYTAIVNPQLTSIEGIDIANDATRFANSTAVGPANFTVVSPTNLQTLQDQFANYLSSDWRSVYYFASNVASAKTKAFSDRLESLRSMLEAQFAVQDNLPGQFTELDPSIAAMQKSKKALGLVQ
jgi:transcriptional regulator with XRE-family HTH domain